MSNIKRRAFLGTIPVAGLAAVVGCRNEPAATRAGGPAKPEAQQAVGDEYAIQAGGEGLVLKISGFTALRLEKASTALQAKTATLYCIDVGTSVANAHHAHYPSLIVPKGALHADNKRRQDGLTRTCLTYNMSGEIKITLPAPATTSLPPVTYTEGSIQKSCPGSGGLPEGLGSFLQPRAGLGRPYDKTVASDSELQARSTAWMALPSGRFEHRDEVRIGDTADISILVQDETTKQYQAVRQVLYYGAPYKGKVTFTFGSGDDLILDCDKQQVVAGFTNLPINEMPAPSKRVKLPEYNALQELSSGRNYGYDVYWEKRCDTGLTAICLCCPPPVEII